MVKLSCAITALITTIALRFEVPSTTQMCMKWCTIHRAYVHFVHSQDVFVQVPISLTSNFSKVRWPCVRYCCSTWATLRMNKCGTTSHSTILTSLVTARCVSNIPGINAGTWLNTLLLQGSEWCPAFDILSFSFTDHLVCVNVFPEGNFKSSASFGTLDLWRRVFVVLSKTSLPCVHEYRAHVQGGTSNSPNYVLFIKLH